jgi:NADH dehydrogenase (ubiquinone) 1 alpha subcomplex subunit 5
VKEIPADAAYRVNVEKITQHRLSIVDGSEDIADVEEKLGIGQLEEVIEIAQDELRLIPHMAEWKPWEVSEAMPPVKIELID